MGTTVAEAPKRPFQYWYDDGLAEIATGILFLLLAALFAAEGLASLPPSFSALGLPVIVIGGMILGGLMVRRIKTRLTYPRTGYVSYPRIGTVRRWLAGALAGLVGLTLVLFLNAHPDWLDALPALQGAAIACVLLLVSIRSGVWRLMIPGTLGLTAGLLAGLAGLNLAYGNTSVYGITGLTLLASGLVVFLRYLRSTYPPAEAV